MGHRALVALAAAAMLVVTLYLARREQDQNHRRSQVVKAVPVPVAVPADRAHDLYQAARTALPETLPSGLTAECWALWKKLRALDLKDAFAKGKPPQILPVGHGCLSVPDRLGETHAQVLKYCGDYASLDRAKEPERWRESRMGCYTSLTLYRAQMTDWMTKDEPLEKIQDAKVLADKTVSRWVENPGSAAEAAERLLELEPRAYPAAKIAAMGRFLDLRRAGEGKGDDASWERVESAISRARDLNPDDRGHLDEMEMGVMISRYQDPERVRRRAEQLIHENPKSGLGSFFLAWVEHKKGNREGVIEYLKRASQAEPQEPRYREALKALQEAKPGVNVGIFGSRMSFPLDSLAPEG